MFCTNCGCRLETGDNFCGKCGRAIKISLTPKADFVEHHEREYKPLPQAPVEPAPTYQPSVSPIKQSKDEKKKAKLMIFKKILEEQSGKEVSEAELNESESWLRQYADVVRDIAIEKAKRDNKLEQNPKTATRWREKATAVQFAVIPYLAKRSGTTNTALSV